MSTTTDKLNVILANANVLFTKIHNFHWNVKGPSFFQLHLKTEEYYNQFATMYDDVAERILQLEEKPLVTLKSILEVATIKEEEKTDFTVEYLLETIIADFETVLKQFEDLSNDESTDAITVAYCDEQIGFIQKELWMLRSSL